MFKNKKLLFINFILQSLALIYTSITYPFIPQRIPAHYDISGNVNRWGSKLELFIMPIFIFIFGLILNLCALKIKNKKTYLQYNLIVFFSLIMLNIITIIFLILSF